jgi:formamidopyrimidine-DNA glycosylase
MPELVDVHIVTGKLRRWLRGATIDRIDTSDRRILRPSSPAAFGRALVGRRVQGVGCRGKWIRIELDGGMRLFSHLGMTGDWLACKRGAPKGASERARFELSGPRAAESVAYLDARRFGRLLAARSDIPEWLQLGPDPLQDGLSARSLAASLAKRRRAVKDALMDQTVLAGIGNIVATEALWFAGVDPRKRCDVLTPDEITAIVRGLKTAIRTEIAHKGEGEQRFRIYGRAGQPCPRCGTRLVSIVVGGRTTALCPRCQRIGRHSERLEHRLDRA